VKIVRYTTASQTVWDAFIRSSRNGLFLFERGYLEYHRDRFHDHSLLIYNDDDDLVAVLPANERDTMLYSHGGLTFGGLIYGMWMRQVRMIETFTALASYAHRQGLQRLVYKPVPHVYHTYLAEEDLYALHLQGAALIERRPITVNARQQPFSSGRAHKVRKAQRAGITIAASHDLPRYWMLLEAVLDEQHQARPVHTLAEMQLLMRAFPHAIHLYLAQRGEELAAGVLVYESQRVARAQYIAANVLGRETNALSALFDHLVHGIYANKPYFDFGTSIEPSTGALNEGLTAHKEDFSARAVMCDTYTLDW
jgi:hypothetical protein